LPVYKRLPKKNSIKIVNNLKNIWRLKKKYYFCYNITDHNGHKQKNKMKKVILAAVAVFAFGSANAQDQTKKGAMLVEANTGFGNGVGTTGLGFTSDETGSAYNLGLEGGYFVMDDLALKVGLGFGGVNPKGGTSISATAYKIGAKYYVISKIPVELSYNGYSSNGFNASWVGIQAGYAIMLGDNVSLEPGLRYNNTMDKLKAVSNLQFNVGFALHF
jgi:hypothetical protein